MFILHTIHTMEINKHGQLVICNYINVTCLTHLLVIVLLTKEEVMFTLYLPRRKTCLHSTYQGGRHVHTLPIKEKEMLIFIKELDENVNSIIIYQLKI